MISSIGIALTGLESASTRLNASASNIANMSTVGSLSDPENPPYTPLTTKSKAIDNPGGVHTDKIPKTNPFIPAYDADSPFADENGIIGVPNVDAAEEMVKMKLAELSYKANLNTIEVASNMFEELLDITDKD